MKIQNAIIINGILFYLNVILSCHFVWKLLVECRSQIKYLVTRNKFYKMSVLMSKFSHLPLHEKYITSDAVDY